MHEPRKNLPKSVIFSLTFIAIVVMYSSLAIILASRTSTRWRQGRWRTRSMNPDERLGPGIAKPVELLFVIGFLASFLALQTSASRVICRTPATARCPGRTCWALSRGLRIPTAAIMVTTVIGAGLFLLSNVATNIYTLMVNFTTGGFYLAFLFPLVGASSSRHAGSGGRPVHARKALAADLPSPRCGPS